MKEKIKKTLRKLYIDGGKNTFLISIKQAFLFLIPVFIIGAGALTLQSFPVAAIRDFIRTVWNGKLNALLMTIYDATYGFAAVYLVISLSFFLSVGISEHKDVHAFCAVSSAVCYFASLGPVLFDGTDLIKYTNMANVFSALIISLVFTKLFRLFYKLFGKNKTDENSVSFERSMHTILPLLFCILIAAGSGWLLSLIPGISNFNDFIVVLFGKLFASLGATYLGGFLVMFFESVLWIFGIHGGNVFDNLLTAPNGTFAFANGQIVSKPFIDTFVLIGGCGTAACLFFAILFFGKDKTKKKLCGIAGGPLLFNINELLIFGLPIVLNPVYVIPFILTPIVSYTISYFATLWGLVPAIVNPDVQWTTPVLISGFQATGSVAGTLLQLTLLVIGTLIYAPFVRLEERIAKENETLYISELTTACRAYEQNGENYRANATSLVLRTFEDNLVSKIGSAIEKGKIVLRYQPQVRNDCIVGAEALLRFRYSEDGEYIYPPLIIGIARNRGLFESLSKAIVERALADLQKMQAQSQIPDIKISVNLTIDLLQDKTFREWLIRKIKTAHVAPHTFGVEITEEAVLSDSVDYSEIFTDLKEAGIKILMDDFSMGHTSITILRKNYFDYVKIDGSLVKNLNDERCRNIVSSIISLGKTLCFNVIAEYVETTEESETLQSLGCDIFQGYLYYKDVSAEELALLLKAQGEKLRLL